MKRDSFVDLLDKKIGRHPPAFLPDSCFVPFQAKKLKNPKMVWLNTDLLADLGIPAALNADLEVISAYIIDTYAFMIPSEERDEVPFFKEESAVFYGDRYGDHGEICNGGSVRCGIRGNFQVKGIGRNQLANKNMDYWHTHGGATIEEGLREAIWGEILNQELPHGASRILAVISTGKTTPYDFGLLKKEEDVEPSGGLIIRQCNVRPAHFMRATFFSPYDKFLNELLPDHIRTKDAVLSLPAVLSGQIGNSASNSGRDDLCNLVGMTFERLAEQVATSKVKRIAHGALTPGNMEISGRYIDFGTTTALCDFSNPVISRGMPPIWSEFEQALSNVLDYSFYINKYLGDDSENTSRSIYALVSDSAGYHYIAQLNMEILKLTGIPAQWLKAYPDQEQCASVFIEALRKDGAINVPLGSVPDSLGAVNPLSFFENLLESYQETKKTTSTLLQRKFNNLISWSLGRALQEGINTFDFITFLKYRIKQFNRDKSCIYRDKIQNLISQTIPDMDDRAEVEEIMWRTIDSALTLSPFDDEIAILEMYKRRNRSISVYRVCHLRFGYGYVVTASKASLNYEHIKSMHADTLDGEVFDYGTFWAGYFHSDSKEIKKFELRTSLGEIIKIVGVACQI